MTIQLKYQIWEWEEENGKKIKVASSDEILWNTEKNGKLPDEVEYVIEATLKRAKRELEEPKYKVLEESKNEINVG